jgi:hypothetical protein
MQVMAVDLFDNHYLDPPTIELLRSIFEDVWTRIEPRTNAFNRDRVRNSIATALIILAKSGQMDPGRLRVYALNKGMTASAP